MKALFSILTVAALSGAAAFAADFSHVERSLTWSKPQAVTNQFGRVRMLRTAQPTEAFWKAWRADKQAMRVAGFSARPTTNGWEALYSKEVAK